MTYIPSRTLLIKLSVHFAKPLEEIVGALKVVPLNDPTLENVITEPARVRESAVRNEAQMEATAVLRIVGTEVKLTCRH
jgi:hypothetical protein